MLVHRSTESLVIDIRATESPSAERDSFLFLDEDYRELEHDELSPVKTRKITTRTMGTMVLFFLQLPQDGFIPEYATRGQRRARRELSRRFVILGDVLYKRSLALPKSGAHIVEQAHSSGCGGHVNSQMLAKKIMRQGPYEK